MAKLEIDVETPLTLAELLVAAEIFGDSARWRSVFELLRRRLPGATRDELLALRTPEIMRLLQDFVTQVLNPGTQAPQGTEVPQAKGH